MNRTIRKLHLGSCCKTRCLIFFLLSVLIVPNAAKGSSDRTNVLIGVNSLNGSGELREPYHDDLSFSFSLVAENIVNREYAYWAGVEVLVKTPKFCILGCSGITEHSGFRTLFGFEKRFRQDSALFNLGLVGGIKRESIDWSASSEFCLFCDSDSWRVTGNDSLVSVFVGPSIGIEFWKIRFEVFFLLNRYLAFERTTSGYIGQEGSSQFDSKFDPSVDFRFNFVVPIQ